MILECIKCDFFSQLQRAQPMFRVNNSNQLLTLINGEEKTKKYHKARKRLGELLSDPGFEIQFRLQTGELMMFDNNRVLHGRTGFCTSEGERHLQGCYIDSDGPRILYRVLEKQLLS